MLGSIVSAGVGELVGGLFGSSSAKKQNKAAIAAAERANAFTREQMQSRHQWEVADLKKAGLNPVLSAGAAPSMGGSAQAPVVGEMADLANSARRLGTIKTERDQAEADLDATRINNGKLVAETNSAEENTKLLRDMQKRANAETEQIRANTALTLKYGPGEATSRIWANSAKGISDINPLNYFRKKGR